MPQRRIPARRTAPGRSVRRSLVVALAALWVAGCQVRTEVRIDVEGDGSGTVEVAVGLDAEARGELPDLDGDAKSGVADLARLVRVDDLRATGWQVTGPATDDDGTTWIRAAKPFATPDEANAVLNEVTGSSGPLGDLEVARSSSFGRDQFHLRGTVDLGGGVEVLSDEGLATALDGLPLGDDPAAIEARLGAPLADMLTLDVVAHLPGSLKAGTGKRDGRSLIWSPDLGGDPVSVDATGTVWEPLALFLVGVAMSSALLLVLLLSSRAVRRLRARSA